MPIQMPPYASNRHATPRLVTRWMLPLLVGYAVLALLGGVLHRPGLSLIAALLLLAALLLPVLRNRSVGALALWLVLAALLLIPAAAGRIQLALSALPVVILCALSWLFARTLRRGQEPLIVRCVRVLEGDERLALPGVARYARGVTAYWACLLAAQALVSLLLLLFARPGGLLDALGVRAPLSIPRDVLLWYPEVGCWIVLVLAFAAEYAFRRWYLRRVPHPPLKRFLLRLVQRWPLLLRGEDLQTAHD